jgi:signal peptidase II
MMFVLATVMVVIDQLSKTWIARTLPLDGADIPLLFGLGITHTRNSGAAFGILRNLELRVAGLVIDGTVLLGLLSLLVSLGLIVYMVRNARRLTLLTRTAFGLVLAGAIGNGIDRLRLGYVIDFIHFKVGSFDFPVFNVADSCVVIGAGLLILGSLFGGESRPPATIVAGPPPPPPRRRPPPLDEYPELPPFGGRTSETSD